ncbi:hypothetical protein BLOT_015895 [Blomia tropicalis]|nr:hypothetical protein BLOT_015895 [Blomia tropicalis]
MENDNDDEQILSSVLLDETMPKRVAIIGAGVCGSATAKACLDQNLDVVVFEKTDYTGGLWRYQPNINENGIASVMRSTVINTSKETFNLRSYVRFRHEVVSVEMANDYEETGRWIVRYRNMKLDEQSIIEEIFDAVAICVGHHNVRNVPTFNGQEQFQGTIIHSHELKHADGFQNKNIVVVGIGNSATDAAVELSSVAKQVYISTRRGSWIFHRVSRNGYPMDLVFQRRILNFLTNLLPYWLICTVMEWYLNEFLDHERYGLKPKHRCLSAHITMNDALPSKIMCGTVIVKDNIERFTKNGVIFCGEEHETQCDTVVLGTGYRVNVPFISETILPINRNRVRLFKHMFVAGLKHPHTLAILGLFQSVGAGIPPGELQCRWFALLVAGKRKLPSKCEMEREIDRQYRYISERYYDSDRHTFQVDWIPYMDDLADRIGCRPPLLRYLFTDPRLWFALVFGVCVPYQYRLTGPNQWNGARNAILTTNERINRPFQTNYVSKNYKTNRFNLTNFSTHNILVIVIICFSFVITFLLSIIGYLIFK